MTLASPVVVDQGSTCTVTGLADAAGVGSDSDPSGSVAFSSDSDGTFGSAACTLAGNSDGSSDCTVTYTPSTVDGGTHTITAAYTPDDDVHAASSDAVGSAVTVNTRSTTTSVDCQPGSIVVDQDTTCTVSVTDVEGLGTTSDPSGTVTFSSSDTGTFDSTTCALAAGAPDDTSTCSVVYTPTAKGTGLHVIGASYGGSTVHSTSFDLDGVEVAVDHRTTSTTSAAPARSSSARTAPAPRRSMTAPASASRPPRRARSTSAAKARVASTPPRASSSRSAPTAAAASHLYPDRGRRRRPHHRRRLHLGEDVHSDSDTSVNGAFDITVDKADTTTTITSDSPDPSVVGQTYTVTWTVTVDAPGAGTPTGTMTVDDGDGNDCSAPVGAGTCDLASTSAGAKTLTATYGGDTNFNSSADTEAHQVDERSTSTSVVCVSPITMGESEHVRCHGYRHRCWQQDRSDRHR